MRKKKKGTNSRMSDGNEIQYRFNALRFLAMSLKSQNDTLKPKTANSGNNVDNMHPTNAHIKQMGGATFWITSLDKSQQNPINPSLAMLCYAMIKNSYFPLSVY